MKIQPEMNSRVGRLCLSFFKSPEPAQEGGWERRLLPLPAPQGFTYCGLTWWWPGDAKEQMRMAGNMNYKPQFQTVNEECQENYCSVWWCFTAFQTLLIDCNVLIRINEKYWLQRSRGQLAEMEGHGYWSSTGLDFRSGSAMKHLPASREVTLPPLTVSSSEGRTKITAPSTGLVTRKGGATWKHCIGYSVQHTQVSLLSLGVCCEGLLY